MGYYAYKGTDPLGQEPLGTANKFIDKQSFTIYTIEEFKEFVDYFAPDIRARVHGDSDGWNQKIDAITEIINNLEIRISDRVWNHEDFEDIINTI